MTVTRTSFSRVVGEHASLRARPADRDFVLPKSMLLAIARRQLNCARHASVGHSALSVCGASTDPLRHLVVALTAGETLDPDLTHECTAWSLQVLHGQVSLTVGRARRFGWPGELMAGPSGPHELLAERDAVLLVTIVSMVG